MSTFIVPDQSHGKELSWQRIYNSRGDAGEPPEQADKAHRKGKAALDEIVPLLWKENAAMDGMSDAERDELARLLGVCCRGYCDGVRELI